MVVFFAILAFGWPTNAVKDLFVNRNAVKHCFVNRSAVNRNAVNYHFVKRNAFDVQPFCHKYCVPVLVTFFIAF